MQKINILITDDHALLRESWAAFFKSDPRFNVVALCASGEEAVEVSKLLKPDIVTMDINLPGISGIEATAQIRKHSPATKILCVSLHTQPAYVRKMIQSGANGYLTKNSPGEELFEAVISIYNSNNKYICKEVRDILSDQLLDDVESNNISKLSRREIEVIGQIKKGHTSREIAESFSLSVKTVEVHRYNILKKLSLPNVAALVNFVNHSALGAEMN